jgi:hypothetical protein
MSKTAMLPYLEALFAVIVWGASFIATKMINNDIPFRFKAIPISRSSSNQTGNTMN